MFAQPSQKLKKTSNTFNGYVKEDSIGTHVQEGGLTSPIIQLTHFVNTCMHTIPIRDLPRQC